MRIPSEVLLCIFGTLVAVLLRCCTTLHPYSGQNKPPMFGDYEAQRHWMEITLNLDINQWYDNSTDNDLLYWGLDYPPLTAYHMYICGQLARFINPEFVALNASRGFESETHKVFMRHTVLCVDILLFIPAIILYYTCTRDNGTVCRIRRNQGVIRKNYAKPNGIPHIESLECSLAIVLALLYPGIILIDHGHFQYNCVSLAFFIYAVMFLLKSHDLLASFFFCLALNYKQMELYHAFPFFLYLLTTCVPKPGHSVSSGLWKLAKISATVILTFAAIWTPFLINLQDAFQVLRRLFPIDRGVFEDKVANVWCTLNVVFKFKNNYTNEGMMRICLFMTASAAFPSSMDLFLRPVLKKFLPALINSSLAFFLFSFQVHEKSILLVAIPVLLHLPNDPFVCFWFLIVSCFSMLPLFVKDGLVIAYFALMVFYAISFVVCMEHTMANSGTIARNKNAFVEYYGNLLRVLLNVEFGKSNTIRKTIKHLVKNQAALKALMLHLLMIVSFIGMAILTVAYLILKPPPAYPDIFPLMIFAYCCFHFVGFFVYFNVVQLKIPQQFDVVKVKTR